MGTFWELWVNKIFLGEERILLRIGRTEGTWCSYTIDTWRKNSRECIKMMDQSEDPRGKQTAHARFTSHELQKPWIRLLIIRRCEQNILKFPKMLRDSIKIMNELGKIMGFALWPRYKKASFFFWQGGAGKVVKEMSLKSSICKWEMIVKRRTCVPSPRLERAQT